MLGLALQIWRHLTKPDVIKLRSPRWRFPLQFSIANHDDILKINNNTHKKFGFLIWRNFFIFYDFMFLWIKKKIRKKQSWNFKLWKISVKLKHKLYPHTKWPESSSCSLNSFFNFKIIHYYVSVIDVFFFVFTCFKIHSTNFLEYIFKM